MLRRDVVKMLAFGASVPLLPAELVAACREIHAGLEARGQLRAFNAHQNATVTAMAECILPETETPGARSTRVNEFIDHIVADWYEAQERARFLAGIADVDLRARRLFGKDFVDANSEQQADVLRGLGEELAEKAKAVATGPRGYRGALPKPEDNFYYQFRGLVLTGYFTSEAGATQQLHKEIIPGHYEGCAPANAAEMQKGSQ